MKKLIVLLVIATLSACAAPKVANQPSAKGKKLMVIATTDFHGALESDVTLTEEGKVVTSGGAAVLATYVERLKKQSDGPWIWVDAGDLFQGTLPSNRFEGAPVVRLYNEMHLTAAAIGNHEFDFGPVGPKAVAREPGDDPRGALKERMKEAKFPFISANIRMSATGEIPDWVKPSTVVTVDGYKIGIVGASTPETPSTTNIMNVSDLQFLDPVTAVQAEGTKLRAQGVDALVLVMHYGGSCDNNALAAQDDLSSCKIKEPFDLVKKLPAGLFDVVVGGHTHRGVAKRIGRTAIIQPFAQGKYVAWATVPLEDKTAPASVGGLEQVCLTVLNTGSKKLCDSYLVKKEKGTVEPATFLGEVVTPNATVVALLKPELDAVAKIKSKRLGSLAEQVFTRSYGTESALGNLVADLTRKVARTDLGVANGGGLRADLSNGPVTYEKLFNVIPFDNQLAVMTVSGEKLYDFVRLGMFKSGGLNWSKNLKAVAKDCELTAVFVNGKIVDRKKNYTVATSDFLATGGSGVASLKIPANQTKVFWDSEFVLRDMIATRLTKEKSKLKVADYYREASPHQIKEGSCKTAEVAPR